MRTTTLSFTPAPDRLDATGAEYRLVLKPGSSTEITVVASAASQPAPPPAALGYGEALRRRRAVTEPLDRGGTEVRSDHDLFAVWVARSRRDLHLLLTETPDGFVPYAGIPWYVAPFGRDALITALQVLPFEPALAAGTLRFFARHVGRVDDAFTDQEPGKIVHELRRGEMAACREIPFIPYYGSVDATPLFVMLLAEYLALDGRPRARRASCGPPPSACSPGCWPSATRTARYLDLPAPLAARAHEPGLEGFARRDHARRRARWPRRPSRWPRRRATSTRRCSPARDRRAPARASGRPHSASGRARCASASRPTSGCPTRPTTRWPSTATARPAA